MEVNYNKIFELGILEYHIKNLNTQYLIDQAYKIKSKDNSKTTKSKDPFIQWAANYLRKNGTPLVPIEKGSNRYLFEEVHESELTDRCVKILFGVPRVNIVV